jgi:hypothetical protein
MGAKRLAILGIPMLTRLKVSLVLIPVALAVLAGIYVYSLWAAERKRAADVPLEATSTLVRDLLAFHKKRGSFPGDLKQLEGVVWETKQNRQFSIEYRGLSYRNYFYLYTQIAPHRFSLWAVPMGQAREEAATFFVTGTLGVYRTWKGAALSTDSVSSIKANPSTIELGTLGLVEQPRVVTQRHSE